MTQFKNDFVNEDAINAKFDERLRRLEELRIDAMLNEVSPSTAVGGMGLPPIVIDPATNEPIESTGADSPVAKIEAEIREVRELRDEAKKSAAKK